MLKAESPTICLHRQPNSTILYRGVYAVNQAMVKMLIEVSAQSDIVNYFEAETILVEPHTTEKNYGQIQQKHLHNKIRAGSKVCYQGSLIRPYSRAIGQPAYTARLLRSAWIQVHFERMNEKEEASK